VTEYLSYQQASPVSRSRLLVAELPQKIQDTFTPLSQEESRSADQLMLFSKMSKELSQAKQPMGSRYSNMSSEIWKKEVIRLRGEYSLRLKLALHTSGRESLSWPTADATNVSDGVPWEISGKQLKERRARVKKAVKEGKTKAGSGRSVNLAMAVQRELAWAKPQLMDFRSDVRKPEERSEKANKGGCSNLREQVHNWKTDKEKKNWSEESSKGWPTPKSRDWKGGLGTDKARQKSDLDKIVLLDGQQDQDKINTSGKSQESSKVLNPNWVEQLMGLPVGWTQLPTEWTD